MRSILIMGASVVLLGVTAPSHAQGPGPTSIPFQGRLVKQVGGNANGVRRGFEDYQPYIPNTGFVPKVKDVPFGNQYPQPLRNILVRNGTLNPDYTVNMATADRLGWKVKEKHEVPAEERHWLSAEKRRTLMKATTAQPMPEPKPMAADKHTAGRK